MLKEPLKIVLKRVTAGDQAYSCCLFRWPADETGFSTVVKTSKNYSLAQKLQPVPGSDKEMNDK